MPNVTTGYGRFSDSIALFENVHVLLNVLNVITSPNLSNYSLLRQKCIGMKDKPL